MDRTSLLVGSELDRGLEALRGPLTGYCYRMLGSLVEAEDAVQETLVRAWRSADRVSDIRGLRPWAYRIATNVCIDVINDRRRRALPMDLAGAGDPRDGLDAALPESLWVQPFPSGLAAGDPSEQTVARESVRLAFIAALQHLLPRQRAVLILRDVLCWKAAEVAELLEMSVDAVNSSLRRARTALADIEPVAALDESVDPELLDRFVSAFQRFDVAAIVALLHHDAVVSMPPYSFWLRGRDAFGEWFTDRFECVPMRLVPLEASGCPAVAVYAEVDGRVEARAIQVLEVRDGLISGLHVFLQPELFEPFGLPPATSFARLAG
ncbi:RNA polymerase subunit sigma-70 [Nocardia concava]|uniref:RNA polymerase subunit sigma-70 n=1 Tax=Nocardia concava TaxID=257281 RepID=UPI000593B7B2|nr:RNA polymerase subunit sigma-70 [Nocardia concava]